MEFLESVNVCVVVPGRNGNKEAYWAFSSDSVEDPCRVEYLWWSVAISSSKFMESWGRYTAEPPIRFSVKDPSVQMSMLSLFMVFCLSCCAIVSG